MDIRAWFLDYVAALEPLTPFLEIKRGHSQRVAQNARALGEALQWTDRLVETLEAAGLLHDIGRFAMHRDHGSAWDAGGHDHGDIGYEELKAVFPWERTDLEPDPLLDVARYHNKRDIPTGCPATSLPFVKAVRDADKIDILEVIQRHVIEGRVDEIFPGVDPSGPPDPALLEAILRDGRAPSEKASSLADVLVLKLTWVFDINFEPTFWHLEKSGLLDWFSDNLPDDEPVREIVYRTRAYVRDRLPGSGTLPATP
jgi:hypothetical protein